MQELIHAIAVGDEDGVRGFIEKNKGLDLRKQDSEICPVIEAFRHGMNGIATLLLKSHQKGDLILNLKLFFHLSKYTAFHMACKHGPLENVKLMCDILSKAISDSENGGDRDLPFDPNARNLDDMTPFHLACGGCDPYIVEHLLGQSFIDTSILTRTVGNCLIHAINERAPIKIIRLLVESKRFDINHRDSGLRTAFNFACIKGYTEAVSLFLEFPEVDTNAVECNHTTPLVNACVTGNLELVKLLLGCMRVKINVPDNSGSGPVHMSALFNHKEIMKLLLDVSELDINMMNARGEKPVNMINSDRQYEVLRMLLFEGGAEVDLDDIGLLFSKNKKSWDPFPYKVLELLLLFVHRGKIGEGGRIQIGDNETDFTNQNRGDMVSEFMSDPEKFQTRLMCRDDFNEEFAEHLLALIKITEDGFMRPKDGGDKKHTRFFAITNQFPLEIKEMVVSRVFRTKRVFIPSQKVNRAMLCWFNKLKRNSLFPQP